MMSAYKVLGVAEDADRDTIRAAYIELAKQHHPDLHGESNGAKQRLQEINQAFDLLKDPERRAGYDRARRQLQPLAWRPHRPRRRWPAVLLGLAFGTLATFSAVAVVPFVLNRVTAPQVVGPRIAAPPSPTAAARTHEAAPVDRRTNTWTDSQTEARTEIRADIPAATTGSTAPPETTGSVTTLPALPHVAAAPSPIETLAAVAAALPRQAERAPEAATPSQPVTAGDAIALPNPAPNPGPLPIPSRAPDTVAAGPRLVPKTLPDVPAGTATPARAPVPLAHNKRSAPEPASLIPPPKPAIKEVAALDTWTTFRNDRFGYKIAYPPDFAARGSIRDDLQRVLVSADGRAQLVISSGYLREATTIASYRSELMRGPYREARFDYTPLRDTWFVLSGTIADREFYDRVTIACNGATYHGFRLVFPAAEGAYYRKVIEIIHAGYKHARGVGPHCNW